MNQRDPEHEAQPPPVIHTDVHALLRRSFELAQDAIIARVTRERQ